MAQIGNKHGLPDRTFKDKLTVLTGNDSIDLYYYGQAHTGDMFANKGNGLIDRNNGGSGLECGATIGKAAAGIKNVDRVITGHSTVLTWQDFVDYGEVNRLVAAHAREAVKAGKTAEQALAEFKLPEKLAGAGFTVTGGGRGGATGNFGIIFEELKTAK